MLKKKSTENEVSKEKKQNRKQEGLCYCKVVKAQVEVDQRLQQR